MDIQKTIYHIRKAYKACPEDYTCKPMIKNWLDYMVAAQRLSLPVYIEQGGVMYRFFRDIAETHENLRGDFYDHCMAVSFAP